MRSLIFIGPLHLLQGRDLKRFLADFETASGQPIVSCDANCFHKLSTLDTLDSRWFPRLWIVNSSPSFALGLSWGRTSGTPKSFWVAPPSGWRRCAGGAWRWCYFVLLLLFHSLGGVGTFFQHAAEGVFRAADRKST